MKKEKHDIIISGAGLAGLSLAYRALKQGLWADQKILILDKASKEKNDRTWCFWQSGQSEFEEIIYKTWAGMKFFSNSGQLIRLDNLPYRYKMIRSIDFYELIIPFLEQQKNVSFLYDDVRLLKAPSGDYEAVTSTVVYQAQYIFNSVYVKPAITDNQQYFLQHFKGIRIKTNQFEGKADKIYLMDFRTSQHNGCSFFYVLPFASDEIFIEYTVFSKNILAQKEYDDQIKIYLRDILKIADYDILEEEFGIIPMTDYPFTRTSGNLINIGSIGGDTRASTGYTFTNTQKTISKILDTFVQQGSPFFTEENISRKHKRYDSTILNVLNENKYKGDEIFTAIFKHTNAKTVFKFLDSESAWYEDLQIITSLKPLPFLKAFLKTFRSS